MALQPLSANYLLCKTMALNDGVLDDIEDANPSIVLPENDIKKSGDSIIVEPITPENKDKESVLTEAQLSELPGMDVQFKMVSDNVAKIADLKDVEADIIGEGTISKEDAKDLSLRIDGFFSKSFSLEHFTVQKSKAGLSDALHRIKQAIAKEQLSVNTLYYTFMSESIEATKRLASVVNDEFVASTIKAVNDYVYDSMKLIESLPKNKNAVFPLNNDFVNITTTDLQAISFDLITVGNNGISVNASAAAIQKILEYTTLKALILGVPESKTLDYLLGPDAVLEYNHRVITIMDLLNFFKSASTVETYINQLYTQLKDNVAKLAKIEENHKALASNEKTYDFVLNTSNEINLINKETSRTVNLINSLRILTLQAGNVIDFYDKL